MMLWFQNWLNSSKFQILPKVLTQSGQLTVSFKKPLFTLSHTLTLSKLGAQSVKSSNIKDTLQFCLLKWKATLRIVQFSFMDISISNHTCWMQDGMLTKDPPKPLLRMENSMEEEGLMMDTVLTARCLPSRHVNNKEFPFHVNII